MSEHIEVRPGQVWADNDPRSSYRRLRVLHLEVRDHWRRLVTDPDQQSAPTHARCCGVVDDWIHGGGWRDIGPHLSIRLDRMRPTPRGGYRLIEDAPEPADRVTPNPQSVPPTGAPAPEEP